MGDSLNPGTLLNWYQIESILGRGGFGTTYLATDINLKTRVAIKEFLPADISTRVLGDEVMPRTDDDQQMYRWGLERFLDEARILAQFKHPNIVRVLTVFEANNTAYMVMEYEHGSNLAALAKDPSYRTEARLKSLFGQILDGLADVHRKNIIHRDIKPANIFVREDGSPVLLDFGSARQSVAGQQKTMTRLMTKGYAPYEQIDEVGGVQGPWTDIYSIGATLYYIVAGELPVDSLSRFTRVVQRRPDPLMPLRKKVEAGIYTRAFLDAIDTALAFEPQDRPQSIDEFTPMLLGERANDPATVFHQPDPDATVLDASVLNTDPFVRSAKRREAAMALDTTGGPSGRLPDPAPEPTRYSTPLSQPTAERTPPPTAPIPPPRSERPASTRATAEPPVLRKAQVVPPEEDFRPHPQARKRRKASFPWWTVGVVLVVAGVAGGVGQLYQSGQLDALLGGAGDAAQTALQRQREQAEQEQARQAELAAQAADEAKRQQAEAEAAAQRQREAAAVAEAERQRQAELEAQQRAAAERAAAARREAEQAARAAAAKQAEERAAAEAAAKRAEQAAAAAAERQAALARQREQAEAAERDAAAAAEREAERQAQLTEQQARTQAEADEAARRANAQEDRLQRLDEQRGKSGYDMLNTRLTAFAEAMKQLDAERLLQISEPTQRSRAIITGVSSRYQRADISISGVTVSEARGVARAVISLSRVYRADGQYVIPGNDWRQFDLTMNREDGIWSPLRW